MSIDSVRQLFVKAGFGAAVLTFAAAVAASSPVLAAGGGGGGGGGAGGGPASIQCNTGYVYDSAKGICVRSSSGLIDDRKLAEEGRLLALDGRYEHALSLLDAVKNKRDAMVLTYIGYSKRKLGNIEEGISYYRQALAIAPGSLNTREYLGEGYVQAGKMELALAQLETLAQLCGTDCEQYEELEMAIAGIPSDWRPEGVAQ